MKKKLLVIPALLVAIGGGAALAQTDLLAKADVNPSISASQAKEIALKQVQGKIVDFDYDGDDHTPHYEIDVVKGNEKIEITVNALTGKSKITERETIQTKNQTSTQNSTNSTPNGLISEQKAIQIAQAKAPGTVVKVELDEDDNQLHYDIKIQNGKTEYEFEIDAKTGSIIHFEEDLDDDDRDDDDYDYDNDDDFND
ncbi:hypothetical protein CSE16_13535 [Solibacillus sp. R5-41]|uniref:PepSY domain-containing protein n=1 Tax=Solibacillus sp. R5-41 TaxID=2048654 RepID=UPI000C124A73|nr:PepSY domain-containing protein [Solibacillus sp. R5-41]ATP40993.1 hypothetical protein CSE16_13535 [Solibacillus sp. R5-41]